MVTLKLNDQKYFLRLLQLFSGHRQVTFEIAPADVKISSLSPPFLYLSIPDNVCASDGAIMFTIDIRELLQALRLLEADAAVLESSFRLHKNANTARETPSSGNSISGAAGQKSISAYIDIPFAQPIIPLYQRLERFSTKFFMEKNSFRGILRGLVTYSNEDWLVVRKSGFGSRETMEIDVEYLEKGELYFHCCNDWAGGVMPLLDVISAILFCFTDGMLHVRIQISKGRGVYLEVQVCERMRVK